MRKVLPSVVARIEAAERRATVERIRDRLLPIWASAAGEALTNPDEHDRHLWRAAAFQTARSDLIAILDEEAPR
jgi:hypothetical protein